MILRKKSFLIWYRWILKFYVMITIWGAAVLSTKHSTGVAQWKYIIKCALTKSMAFFAYKNKCLLLCVWHVHILIVVTLNIWIKFTIHGPRLHYQNQSWNKWHLLCIHRLTIKLRKLSQITTLLFKIYKTTCILGCIFIIKDFPCTDLCFFCSASRFTRSFPASSSAVLKSSLSNESNCRSLNGNDKNTQILPSQWPLWPHSLANQWLCFSHVAFMTPQLGQSMTVSPR